MKRERTRLEGTLQLCVSTSQLIAFEGTSQLRVSTSQPFEGTSQLRCSVALHATMDLVKESFAHASMAKSSSPISAPSKLIADMCIHAR